MLQTWRCDITLELKSTKLPITCKKTENNQVCNVPLFNHSYCKKKTFQAFD